MYGLMPSSALNVNARSGKEPYIFAHWSSRLEASPTRSLWQAYILWAPSRRDMYPHLIIRDWKVTAIEGQFSHNHTTIAEVF